MVARGSNMRVTIISESGDWKEMLYTKDIVTYEIKNKEILDFFVKLGDAYANNDTLDDMFVKRLNIQLYDKPKYSLYLELMMILIMMIKIKLKYLIHMTIFMQAGVN